MENKPICYVPGREIPNVYSGVPSFVGVPLISKPEDIDEHDAVVFGMPGKVHVPPVHGLDQSLGRRQ